MKCGLYEGHMGGKMGGGGGISKYILPVHCI